MAFVTGRTRGVLRPFRWGLTLVVLASLSSAPADGQPSCRVTGESMKVTALPEASGVAASRRTPGLLWSHNDSGEPVLVAVATDGTTRGRVYVSGASAGDWEDIAVGPCPQGSCIYIGDIGDNRARRRAIFIYRVPEPDAGTAVSARAESMRVSYPDGPRDAEALIVLPDGSLFVVTKGELGAVALYRVPEAFRNGATAQLERIATLMEPEGGRAGRVARRNRITGASASSDGRWVVLRTLYNLTFYNAADFKTGNIREAFRYDVSGIREPQGEGVAFGEDGAVWLASEGGGNKRPGTIARLDCSFK
jgi:hypothetical protein